MSNLTIDGGVRWEKQDVKDRTGKTAIDLTTNWAPRVGVVWDFAKNGRSKIFANYGRFFESIPLDIDIRAFGGELAAFSLQLRSEPEQSHSGSEPRRRRTASSAARPSRSNPNLHGQYITEFLAGGEFEVAPNLSVGVKYLRRDLGRVIEDFLVPSERRLLHRQPG